MKAYGERWIGGKMYLRGIFTGEGGNFTIQEEN